VIFVLNLLCMGHVGTSRTNGQPAKRCKIQRSHNAGKLSERLNIALIIQRKSTLQRNFSVMELVLLGKGTNVARPETAFQKSLI
jgi:hypothetical protein